MKRAKKGFTLVEVVIVLVIIAIIAAVAVPNISGYIDRSKKNNCETAMKNFVNDMQSTVVSKRFYDISDLNSALAETVLSHGEADEAAMTDGNTFQISGICPNGGVYSFRWQITPDKTETDGNNVKSADVQLGTGNSSSGYYCECNCMSADDEHIKVNARSLKAALISNEYKESKTASQFVEEFILNLVASVEGAGRKDTDQIIKEYNEIPDRVYSVTGITVNESSGKVEWVCAYPRDTRGADSIVYTVYTNEDEVVFRDVSVNVSDMDKPEMLPPAEGSVGSSVYREGWNASVKYQTGFIGQTYSDKENSGEAVTVKWIQRDGNWYVQENNTVKGIDFTFADDSVYTSENHPLFSKSRLVNKTSDAEQLRISTVTNASLTDIEKAFNIGAVYDNGKTVNLEHLEVKTENRYVTETGVTVRETASDFNEYNIKNGFVFLNETKKNAAVNGTLTWAGVFTDSSLADRDKTNLEDILMNESKVLDDFIKSESAVMYIAYQEYYKEYDSAGKLCSYEPVTKVAKIERAGNYTPDGDISYEDGSIIIPVNVPVKIDGAPSVMKYTEKQPVPVNPTDITPENNEIKAEDETVVARLVPDEKPADYIVEYDKNDIERQSFKASDITVKKNIVYKLVDKNGAEIKQPNGTDNVTFTKTVTIPHAGEDGAAEKEYFYLALQNDTPMTGYVPEKEERAVRAVNSGSSNPSAVFLKNTSYSAEDTTTLASISSRYSGVSWEYDESGSTGGFDIDKIKIKGTYTVEVNATVNNYYNASGKNSGTLVSQLPHKNAADMAGYYIAYQVTGGDQSVNKWNSSRESEILNTALKGTSANAVIYRVAASDDNNPQLVCTVSSKLESISASYNNKAGSTFSTGAIKADAVYSVEITGSGDQSDNWHQKKYTVSNDHTVALVYHGSAAEGAKNAFWLSEAKQDEYYTMDRASSAEAPVIQQLNASGNGEPYVLFRDGVTKSAQITVNAGGMNIPDFIYLPYNPSDNGNRMVKIVGYRGTSKEMSIQPSYTGYWTTSLTEADMKFPYAPGQKDGDTTYYYVDDGNSYRVVRVGNGNPNVASGGTNPIDSIRLYRISKVKSVSVAEGITEIGADAFNKLSMEENGSISIPSTVKIIGPSAFEEAGSVNSVNNLTAFNLASENSALNVIKRNAFKNMVISSSTAAFTVPSSVTEIGEGAFAGFEIPEGKLVINGISGEEEAGPAQPKPAPQGAVSAAENNVTGIISENIFAGSDRKARVKNLEIGGSVDKIGPNACKNIEFTSDVSVLKICDNVSVVGSEAFSGTDFRKLSLGDKVDRIEAGAFMNCSEFNGKLNLNKVTHIGQYAFQGLEKATEGLLIPDGVTDIGLQAFDGFAKNAAPGKLDIQGCSYVSSDGTERHLGALIFTNANFNETEISGVTDIDAYAFRNSPYKGKTPYNSLKGSLTLSSSVKNIGTSAFEDCTEFTGVLNLRSNNIHEISDAAFLGCCKFTSLELPDSVSIIGSRAFMECHGLTGELDLKSVDSIGMQAFKNCINMSGDLNIPVSVTGKIGFCAFENYAKNSVDDKSSDKSTGGLIINSGSSDGGKVLGAFIFPGSKFNRISIGGNVETVSDYAFKNVTDESEALNIYPDSELDHNNDGHRKPDSVQNYNEDTSEEDALKEYKTDSEKLSKDVIYDYSNITGVLTLGEGVKTIGNEAFRSCSISGDLDLNQTETVGNSAFKNCTSLNGSFTAEKVTSIGSSAFENCEALKGGINLPETTGIGADAFKECGSLDGNLNIPKIVTIGSGAFYNCVKLDGPVEIPQQVTFIGQDAFRNYSSESDRPGTLTLNAGSVESGTRLGGQIFLGSQFTGVKIGGKITRINQFAFFDPTVEEHDEYGTEYESTLNSLGYSGKKPDVYYSRISGPLTIGGSVTEIGECAFAGCSKLDGGLEISSSVHKIEENAFAYFGSAGNSQGKLTINGYSGKASYSEEVSGYPSGYEFKKIDTGIFPYARFNEIEIGGEVELIADRFLSNYEGESTGNTGKYTNIGGKLTIDRTVAVIGESAFAGCYGLNSEVKLDCDAAGAGSSLKYIGHDAFNDCLNINGNLVIPASVEEIGHYAFRHFGQGKKTSDMSSGNTGSLKIYGCSSADGDNPYDGNDEHNGSYKMIEGEIFDHSHFKDVFVGGSVEYIAANFMENVSEDTFYINGNEVTSTGYNAVRGNLEIGNQVLIIGDRAFQNCENFSGLTIGTGVRYIGEKAFSNGKNFRGSLNLNNVENIGEEAFFCCGFDGTLSMNSARRIGSGAFSGCTSFYTSVSGEKAVTIPDSVVLLGSDAFYKFAYNTVSYYDTHNADGSIISGKTVNSPSLKILGGTEKNDEVTLNSGIFKFAKFYNVEIGGKVRHIADDCFNNGVGKIYGTDNYRGDYFYDDNGIRSTGRQPLYNGIGGYLKIGKGVSDIGTEAFYECREFNGELKFDDDTVSCTVEAAADALKLRSIGVNAFTRCERFTGGLTIPNEVRFIGQSAFKSFAHSVKNPDDIGQLVIRGGTNDTVLENNRSGPVFTNSKFRNVTIGGAVTKIGPSFFSNWKHVISDIKRDYVDVGEVNEYEADTDNYNFDGITGNVLITDHVKEIGDYAFVGCPVSRVEIDRCVSVIGEMAFMYAGKYADENGTEENQAAEGDAEIPDLVILGGSNGYVDGNENYQDSSTVEIGSDCNGKKQYIFLGSKFENIRIGGKVQKISENFMVSYHNSETPYYADFMDNDFTYRQLISHDGLTGTLSLDKTVEVVSDNAFRNCTGLTGLSLIEDYKVKDGRLDKENSSKLRMIGSGSFSGCTGMKGNLTIPFSVSSIGQDAFYSFGSATAEDKHGVLVVHGCSEFDGTKICDDYFPEEGELGSGIFDMAHFNGVEIGWNVRKINQHFMHTGSDGNRNYDYTGIKGHLYIGRTVKEIRADAFNGAGFDGGLLIDNNVFDDSSNKNFLSIGANAFDNCTEFYTNFEAKTINGGANTLTKELILPTRVNSVGSKAFNSFASSCTTDAQKPALVIQGGTSDTTVGHKTDNKDNDIFWNAKFHNVTIGTSKDAVNAATKVEAGFFNNTASTESGRPASAYDGITGNLTFGESVQTIGGYSFMNTKFDGQLMLGGVDTIASHAFDDCKNFYKNGGKFEIPGSVHSIGEFAFNNFCKDSNTKPELIVNGYGRTTSYQMGFGYGSDTVTALANSYFNNVTFGGNVAVIGVNAFYDSNNKSYYSNWSGTLDITSNVKYVYEKAMMEHKFTLIRKAKSVKYGSTNTSNGKWESNLLRYNRDVFGHKTTYWGTEYEATSYVDSYTFSTY